MREHSDNHTIPGIGALIDVDPFHGTKARVDAPGPPPSKAPVGDTVSAGCNTIADWTQDQDTPDQPLHVQLYLANDPGQSSGCAPAPGAKGGGAAGLGLIVRALATWRRRGRADYATSDRWST